MGGAAFWKAYKAANFDDSDLMPFENPGPFLQRRQVGIGLKQRQTVDGAFYVKTEFDLSARWAFSVIAHLNTDKPKLSKTIFLGGDQSVFFLECTPLNDGDSLTENHPLLKRLIQGGGGESGSVKKAVAISPLILEKEHPLTEKADHAVISRIDRVRMLHSVKVPYQKKNGDPEKEEKIDPEKVNRHFRHNRRILKSDAYRSMPAGSVFYSQFGMEFKDIRAEKSDSLIHLIGYNHLIYL